MEARARTPAGGIVAAVVAALLAAAGVGALVRTFGAERRELDAAVAGERAAVEAEVARAFDAAVRAHLEVARLRVARALEDPLTEAPHVVAIEAGRVVWPRPVGAEVAGLSVEAWEARLGGGEAAGARVVGEPAARVPAEPAARVSAEAAARAATPSRGSLDARDVDEAITERRVLLASIGRAAAARDDDAATRAFRALLVARARTVLEPRAELATALLALDALGARASQAIVRAVIEDGLADPRAGRVESVARLLARARPQLTADALAAVCGRARAHLVAVAVTPRLLARACAPDAEVAPPPVIALAATVTASAAPARSGAWWLLADGPRVVGARVDVPAELAAQAARLVDRGLDGAQVSEDRGGRLRVEAPRWDEVRARAGLWYARKLMLLLGATLITALAVIVVGWSRADARRREREMLELKAQFAATVSHELQTPLAAVRVMAETLERRLEGEPRARDYPRRIVGEVDRLSGLVDNILAFQRIEQGRWEVRRAPVRLDDLVGDLVSEAERAAGRSVEVEVAGVSGVELEADERLLRLALLNLVRNACRHNRRDPVRVTLRASPGRVEVEDNGVGVPAEDVPRLFTTNVRGRGAVGQGTGLGLALVARIARLHGGRAELVRTGPEGSTFALSW